MRVLRWWTRREETVEALQFLGENHADIVALDPADLHFHERRIGPGCSEVAIHSRTQGDPLRIGGWAVREGDRVIFMSDLAFRTIYRGAGY